MKGVIDLLGRVFIAFISLFEAYDSLTHLSSTQDTMTEYGITWNQEFLLSIAIGGLFLGGVLVLLGYRSTFGAMLLLCYWIPITFIVHSFWNDPVEIQRQQSVHFMKNIAIIGGLLIVSVNDSGRYRIRRLWATTRVKQR